MEYILPMKPKYSRSFLERTLSKRYFKKPYDRFMWWRMYTPKNKPLDKRKSFIDRITTGGEVDHSKYHAETSIDRARMKRLLEDHEKEECRKLDDIKRNFITKFKMSSEQYDKEVLNTSAKDLTDFYFKMETKYGTYWQPIKMPDNLTNQSIY